MEQVKQKYGIWRWRDPMSALTHMIGFFLAIPFGILLIVQQALQENTAGVVGCTVFVLSVLLLYGASTYYHMAQGTPEQIAFRRKVDHMMIFVLIAGSYTPVCLVNLSGFWGNLLLCLWRIVFEAILVGCTQVAFDDHLCGDGMAGTGGVLPLVTGGGLGRHFVVSRRGNDVYAGGCDLCHEVETAEDAVFWVP